MSEQDKSSDKESPSAHENANSDGDVSNGKIADNADVNADETSDASYTDSADDNADSNIVDTATDHVDASTDANIDDTSVDSVDANADDTSTDSVDANADDTSTDSADANIDDTSADSVAANADANVDDTSADKMAASADANAEDTSTANADSNIDANTSIQEQYEYAISDDNFNHSEDSKSEHTSDDKIAENTINSDSNVPTKAKDNVIKDSADIQKKHNTSPSETEGINPDLPEAKPMTLMQHLGELRTRIVRAAIAISLAFMVTYSFADIIFSELIRPLAKVLPPDSKLIFTSLPEAFFLELQIGFVAAIFLASPFLFYQIWSFIAPGLYDEEKKYAIPIAIISALFFICGAAFCYFIVFPFSFEYFMSFATDTIIPMPSISLYFNFTLKILIAFGLIFEMPLFTFFLSRMGIVTASAMRKVRKYAVLAIFIIAAILTPPDVISQLLMAIPMIFLYEVSIYIAVVFGKKPKVKNDDDDEEAKNDNKTNDETKNKDKTI